VLNPPNLPGWRRAGAISCRRPSAESRLRRGDANAAALAEWHFSARALQARLDVTGVGGGDPRCASTAASSSAGEFGHAPVEWDASRAAADAAAVSGVHRRRGLDAPAAPDRAGRSASWRSPVRAPQ
jgi:hypothetical protein